MLGRLLTGLLLAGGLGLAGGVVRAAPVAPAVAAEPIPAATPSKPVAIDPVPVTKLGTESSPGVPLVPNFEGLGAVTPPAPAPAPPVTTTTLAPPPAIATHAALVTAAPAEARRRPISVSIEGLGVVAPVVATGVDPGTGQLAIPGDADTVVWYEHGASPGEDGSAVIAGHVDYNGRRGVFFDLDDVAVGSIVTITHDDGTSTPFQVVDRRSHAKPELPTSELFRRQGEPVLVLITCGGEFDREARSYRSNVVVTAVPVR